MTVDTTITLPEITYPESYSLQLSVIEDQIQDGFPYVIDRVSLANLCGIELKTMTWLLQKERDDHGKDTFVKNTLYECYRIPKPMTARDRRAGRQRYRHIQNPHTTLKVMQRNFVEGFWEQFPLPEYVTSFRKGMSIQDAAKIHSGRELVMSIDLEDFFPSIKEHMIRSFLQDHGYPYEVARTLSELSTFKAFLPQGSPSSPIISNLIGYHRFDKEIDKLARDAGFEYTRYADDLIFSSVENSASAWGAADELYQKVAKVISKAGFRISHRKTKFMRQGVRQRVLGAIVNTPPEHDPSHGKWGYIRIPMQDYLNTRAKLHDALINGLDKAGERHGLSGHSFLKHLEGYVNSYVKQTDERRWLKLAPVLDIIKRKHRALTRSRERHETISTSADSATTSSEEAFVAAANKTNNQSLSITTQKPDSVMP